MKAKKYMIMIFVFVLLCVSSTGTTLALGELPQLNVLPEIKDPLEKTLPDIDLLKIPPDDIEAKSVKIGSKISIFVDLMSYAEEVTAVVYDGKTLTKGEGGFSISSSMTYAFINIDSSILSTELYEMSKNFKGKFSSEERSWILLFAK